MRINEKTNLKEKNHNIVKTSNGPQAQGAIAENCKLFSPVGNQTLATAEKLSKIKYLSMKEKNLSPVSTTLIPESHIPCAHVLTSQTPRPCALLVAAIGSPISDLKYRQNADMGILKF